MSVGISANVVPGKFEESRRNTDDIAEYLTSLWLCAILDGADGERGTSKVVFRAKHCGECEFG